MGKVKYFVFSVVHSLGFFNHLLQLFNKRQDMTLYIPISIITPGCVRSCVCVFVRTCENGNKKKHVQYICKLPPGLTYNSASAIFPFVTSYLNITPTSPPNNQTQLTWSLLVPSSVPLRAGGTVHKPVILHLPLPHLVGLGHVPLAGVPVWWAGRGTPG